MENITPIDNSITETITGDMEGGADKGETKALAPEWVYLGDTVKATTLEDGSVKLAGYLIRYGDEKKTDLLGDFFAPDTDYGDVEESSVYFNHRMPVKVGKQSVEYKERFADKAKLTTDEIGIFAEIVINARNEYEKMIADLGLKGILGWSSGTAPHLVERESKGNGVYKIKKWDLGLDASLTPTPAEHRNMVISVKALSQGAGAREDVAIVETIKSEIPTEETKMELTKEELADIVNNASATAAENAVKKFTDALPEVKSGFNVEVVTDEADQPFDSLAEQLWAVKDFANSYGQKMDVRLKALEIKAPLGMNEGVPSQGGFLLQPTISDEFLKPIHQEGVFSRLARRLPVGSNSNSGWINGIDETSRANGSRWGGVQAYWRAEAGTVTATKPKFRRVNWELNALEALMYITDEQLQDASMTAAIARESAAEELNFKVNDAILNGDGVGKPKGILAGGSLITVTRQNANAVLFLDILNMWQRLHPANRANSAWFVNSEVEPQLDQLYLTSSLEARYITYGSDGVMRMKGRPVIVTEFNAALGTAGDILLADMTDYLMWEKGGIQSSVNPWIQWLTSEQAFKFTYRVDGQPATYSALTPYKGSNTQSPYVALLATS